MLCRIHTDPRPPFQVVWYARGLRHCAGFTSAGAAESLRNDLAKLGVPSTLYDNRHNVVLN